MHRRIATSALSLLLASALVLAPMRGALAASDDATITVWTKDGGMFRGEVVERVPNDHVTIKLATGETKRIEWKDIERDSIAPAPTAAPTNAPKGIDEPGADVVAAPVHVGPRIHLVGPATLSLERDAGHAVTEGGGVGLTRYELVCRAPCDVEVPAGSGYRVAGDDRGSRSFTIAPGDRAIGAHFGSKGSLGAGIALLSVGVAALFAAEVDFVRHSGPLLFNGDDGERKLEGGAFLVAGLVMTVVGIGLMISYGSSSVEIDGRTVASTKPRSTFALTPTGFVF